MAESLTNPNFITSSRSDRLRHRPSANSALESRAFSSGLKSGDFRGGRICLRPGRVSPIRPISGFRASMTSQTGFRIGKAQKWWEKGLQPNMKEVTSAQDLVDSLSNAGEKLAVVDFYSPGCGGCKALHPKLCQIAEMNPDVQFLQINYEEHKSMCYSLNVHVLPFFRFYRGAHGRLCSFSCTNATVYSLLSSSSPSPSADLAAMVQIKKFRDALMKHKTDRCSLGPTKGLEEKELLALAANKELSFSYTPTKRSTEEDEEEDESAAIVAGGASPPASSISAQASNKAYVHAWR